MAVALALNNKFPNRIQEYLGVYFTKQSNFARRNLKSTWTEKNCSRKYLAMPRDIFKGVADNN